MNKHKRRSCHRNPGTWISLVFCIGVMMISFPCQAAPDIALVNSLRGQAFVDLGGSENTLELFDTLVPGMHVKTGPETDVVLTFYSGERYRIKANSVVTVQTDGLKTVRGTVETLEPVSVMPQIVPLARSEKPGKRQASIRVRELSVKKASFYPPHPKGVILADKAELSYPEPDKGRMYVIEVRDDQGVVIHSVQTREHSIVLPADLLAPGKSYFWRVTTKEEPVQTLVDFATFTTLSQDKVALRQTLHKQAEASGDSSLRLLAVRFDYDLGLYREACSVLNDLIKKRQATEAELTAWHKCECSKYK